MKAESAFMFPGNRVALLQVTSKGNHINLAVFIVSWTTLENMRRLAHRCLSGNKLKKLPECYTAAVGGGGGSF
jgi:hypothetical protein